MTVSTMTISLEEHVARVKEEAWREAARRCQDVPKGHLPDYFNSIADEVSRAVIAAVREREGASKSDDDPLGLQPQVDALAASIRESERAACEVQEWEGYINGLTRAGNLRSRLVVDDSTGSVLNDIRRQIQDEIEKAQARIAARKGNGEGK